MSQSPAAREAKRRYRNTLLGKSRHNLYEHRRRLKTLTDPERIALCQRRITDWEAALAMALNAQKIG